MFGVSPQFVPSESEEKHFCFNKTSHLQHEQITLAIRKPVQTFLPILFNFSTASGKEKQTDKYQLHTYIFSVDIDWLRFLPLIILLRRAFTRLCSVIFASYRDLIVKGVNYLGDARARVQVAHEAWPF